MTKFENNIDSLIYKLKHIYVCTFFWFHFSQNFCRFHLFRCGRSICGPSSLTPKWVEWIYGNRYEGIWSMKINVFSRKFESNALIFFD